MRVSWFHGILNACTNSVYQALSPPPLNGPGNRYTTCTYLVHVPTEYTLHVQHNATLFTYIHTNKLLGGLYERLGLLSKPVLQVYEGSGSWYCLPRGRSLLQLWTQREREKRANIRCGEEGGVCVSVALITHVSYAPWLEWWGGARSQPWACDGLYLESSASRALRARTLSSWLVWCCWPSCPPWPSLSPAGGGPGGSASTPLSEALHPRGAMRALIRLCMILTSVNV